MTEKPASPCHSTDSVKEGSAGVVFADAIGGYLLPLFPGAAILEPRIAPADASDGIVSDVQGESGTVLVKPAAEAEYAVKIQRVPAFSAWEKQIMEAFVMSADRLCEAWPTAHKREVASSVMAEVVARCVCFDGLRDTVAEVISLLGEWSQQTYEGRQISITFGLHKKSDAEAHGQGLEHLHLRRLRSQNFLKVLSNGVESLLVLSHDGHLVGHSRLNQQRAEDDALFAPLRYLRVAAWTKRAKAVAITLTPTGEILAFSAGALVFAKRRGSWRHFPHLPFVSQLARDALPESGDNAVRRAIYLSALDVAFARTGGCLGGFSRTAEADGIEACLRPGQVLPHPSDDPQALALNQIIAGRRFHEIDRQLRLELLSMDGATVLRADGTILTAGSIIRLTEINTESGGREAATRSLARFGLGIKVSSDGFVCAYGASDNLLFELG